jgi:hypothetical protein
MNSFKEKYQNECQSTKDLVVAFQTADTYDSVKNIHGKKIWVISLVPNECVMSIPDTLIIWDNCPGKETMKISVTHKKSSTHKKSKKIIKSEPVVKDTCISKKEDLDKPYTTEVNFDNLSKVNLEVNLTKQYRDDKIITLVKKEVPLSLSNLFSMNNTLLEESHTYIEYLPNPYRQKAENSFWTGVTFGIASAGCYAISEGMGHPKYWDGLDNSAAEKKSNQIQALRVASTIFGTASVLEFGRTVYFHNMESKFIINPTKIGLTINLDSKNLDSK